MESILKNTETAKNLMRAFAGEARPETAILLRRQRRKRRDSLLLKQCFSLRRLRNRSTQRYFTAF